MIFAFPIDIPFVNYIFAFLISAGLLLKNITLNLPYFWFRKMSTAIYFTHMYFVTFEKYFCTEIYSDFYSKYLFASVFTVLLSAILVKYSKRNSLISEII